MQGAEQTHASPLLRAVLTVLVGLAGLACLAAWPSAAGAVSFSGPTANPVGTAPQSISVADFNADSDPDMAIVNEFSHNIQILVGGAGGSFTSVATYGAGTRPLWIDVGNFNGDSDPDLAVANESTNNVSIYLGGAGASFTGPTNYVAGGSKPQAVAIGDFNGDSDPDLAVPSELTNDVSIMLGGAGGSFGAPTTFPVGGTPRSVEVGNFNGDSDPDLAVSNELSNDVSILLGDAGATFTAAINYPVGSSPTSVTVGDFNGDGRDDLATANELSHTVSVLTGASGGSFGSAVNFTAGTLPDTVAVGEFNGDSDPDIAVANQGSNSFGVLFGSSGSGFVGPSTFFAGDGPTAVGVGDFDGDSYDDVAIATELINSIAVLLNTPPETTIDSGPPALTNDSTPTFTFSSNSAQATFQCRVNGGSFGACSSPYTTPTLANGARTVEVRALEGGRLDPTPALWSFTVDTVAPPAPTSLSVTPASPANDNNPFVNGTAEAGSSVNLYTTGDCSGAAAATGLAAAFATGLQVFVTNNSTTIFRATATDAAGNRGTCSTSSVKYEEVSPADEPPAKPPGSGGSTPTPPAGGAPPAGAAPTPDTSAPTMALAGKSVKMDANGRIAVSIACPSSEPGGCEGMLALEATVLVRTSKAAASRARPSRRKLKLGSSFFRVAGGASLSVKVRPSKRNQRLLRKLGKLAVVVIVNARDQAGNAKTTKKGLTLKAPVKRKR